MEPKEVAGGRASARVLDVNRRHCERVRRA